nr:hypothetical protein [Tanacetum cinerariifolium]
MAYSLARLRKSDEGCAGLLEALLVSLSWRQTKDYMVIIVGQVIKCQRRGRIIGTSHVTGDLRWSDCYSHGLNRDTLYRVIIYSGSGMILVMEWSGMNLTEGVDWEAERLNAISKRLRGRLCKRLIGRLCNRFSRKLFRRTLMMLCLLYGGGYMSKRLSRRLCKRLVGRLCKRFSGKLFRRTLMMLCLLYGGGYM